MAKLAQWLHLPVNASAHGAEIDNLIIYVHLGMFVLFVGWGAFFIYTLFRYRAKKNPKADYQGVKSHYSTYVEIAVVIVEAVLLIGFSIPLWAKVVDDFPSAKDSVVVRVVAQQFAWNIHYPGVDGIFGKTDASLINEQSNPVGLDRSDPNAADDITTINQLHLPVDKPVIIHLSSKDVLHSFYLPEMRVKQDAIPGMSIPLWFKPVKTGNWEIACAQLCGLGHYRMRGFLHIHSQNDYDAWLKEQDDLLQGAPQDDFWN
ncbi:cytochrome c oxidase subunit II [PVC group bacterium]|nr:cytochrome c oxidase subunit II [PVC group bacterium]